MAWHWAERIDDFYQLIMIFWVFVQFTVGKGDTKFLIEIFQGSEGFLK